MPSLAQELKRYKDSIPHREQLKSEIESYINIRTVQRMFKAYPDLELSLEPIEINSFPLKASLHYIDPNDYHHPIKLKRFRFTIQHVNPNINTPRTALTVLIGIHRDQPYPDYIAPLFAIIEKLNPEYLTQDPLTILQQLIGYDPKPNYKLIRTTHKPRHFKKK